MKFIGQKTQSKIVTVFTAIAILFFMVWLSIQPWNWIEPQYGLTKCLTVFLCVLLFILIAIIVCGVFMKDIKFPDDENEIIN